MTWQPISWGVIFLALVLTAGCHPANDDTGHAVHEKPAKVTPLPDEANLAEVELASSAYDRLGISISRVELKDLTEVRMLGGEVVIPPGESAVVVAPVSGTVETVDESSIPKPGAVVKKGQLIFNLRPLLTPERFVPTPAERAQIANAQASLISLQMAADGDVQQFVEQVTAAQIALNRAQQLLRDRVGSERSVDDAKAQLALAEARLKVAKERKTVLDQLTSDIDKVSTAPITFESPIDGILRAMPVTLGQMVPVGTTLFEVVNLDVIWIRVPVYVGLLEELQQTEPARVTFFGDDGQRRTYEAQPVKAPPNADPLSSTADLFYSIVNQQGRFRPGERVSVEIPLSTQTESLVIPINAILYDIYGGTWVYERTGERKFRRSRVIVQRTTEDLAILKQGIPLGTEVVVDGAAELFGTEFGTGK